MMTPIPAVVTVDVSQDVETALRLCVSSGHTRLVVTEDEDRDRVRGHRARQRRSPRQLMQDGPARARSSRSCTTRRSCPRPSRSTTCSPTCSASAPRWRSSSTSTAASSAIVTVEDIIEEVVGEIADETDPAAGEVRRLANGDWFVRGHVAVTDLADYGLRPAGRQRRLQLGRRLRVRRARPPAAPRRHRHRRRLLDPRRVGARQPHRGGAHPRAPARRSRAPSASARR